MSFIPCSLNCAYQVDGICKMDFPQSLSLKNEKCPHFVEKEEKAQKKTDV